jgi:hypothetical protein
MKTVSRGVAILPSSLNTEVHHFICLNCCCCLSENVGIKGKIQLHYKVIKLVLQLLVTFSRREVINFS